MTKVVNTTADIMDLSTMAGQLRALLHGCERLTESAFLDEEEETDAANDALNLFYMAVDLSEDLASALAEKTDASEPVEIVNCPNLGGADPVTDDQE